MTGLRALVVDDEPLARESVRLLLDRDSDIAMIQEAASGRDALELMDREEFDLVFLDIQMPELTGFDVVSRMKAPLPAIIFITAYDTYAVRAFEVHAIDYLLKPFTDERFRQALGRARKTRTLATAAEASALAEEIAAARASEPLKRLLVRTGEKLVVVRSEEIDWIEAADYYARLHVGSNSYLIREALSEFEKKLDREQFFRVHRSAIVNIDRVKEIHNTFKGDAVVVLQGDTQVPLSRTRRDDFERVLGRLR